MLSSPPPSAGSWHAGFLMLRSRWPTDVSAAAWQTDKDLEAYSPQRAERFGARSFSFSGHQPPAEMKSVLDVGTGRQTCRGCSRPTAARCPRGRFLSPAAGADLRRHRTPAPELPDCSPAGRVHQPAGKEHGVGEVVVYGEDEGPVDGHLLGRKRRFHADLH